MPAPLSLFQAAPRAGIRVDQFLDIGHTYTGDRLCSDFEADESYRFGALHSGEASSSLVCDQPHGLAVDTDTPDLRAPSARATRTPIDG